MAEKTAARKTEKKASKYSRPGTNQLVPLDYAILATLPPEGSMLGYHVLAVPVRGITTELKKSDENLTSTAVAGRVSLLHQLGYVAGATILPVAKGRGWQITPKGQKVLSAWTNEQTKN